MAEPRLAIERLSVWRGRRQVVDGVSFAAPAGALTVLLGPNGAGKSTVLKAVVGLLPYLGGVRIDGQDGAGLGRRARARLLAYVPQHSALGAVRPVAAVGGRCACLAR